MEEGTTTADSLSFKGGMRNYVYSSTASQQYITYYKACAIMRVPFFQRKVDERFFIFPILRNQISSIPEPRKTDAKIMLFYGKYGSARQEIFR